MASSGYPLYIFQEPSRTNQPSVWVLQMAEDPRTDIATWYHTRHKPSGGYELLTYSQQLEQSNLYLVGTIPATNRSDANRIISNATPRSSQQWVVDVLAILEKNGLILKGKTEEWANRMEAGPSEASPSEAGPSDTGAAAHGRGAHKNPRCCGIF